MQIYIIFGLPGSGKTYVGEIFKKYFQFYFHDGDTDLPDDMLEALRRQAPISDEMRDNFFSQLISSIRKLEKKHQKLAIAQTFIKEIYRTRVASEFPSAHFLYIQTQTQIREARLMRRKSYPIDKEYARKMSRNFDPPSINQRTLINNAQGEESIKQQIQTMINLG